MKVSPDRRLEWRRGFTLVELAIVVLVLGILAAVAAPKMTGTVTASRTSATQQSLRALRGAIEMHRAQSGNFPTAANITTALQPYLSGPFPSVEVGSNPNAVVVASTQDPILTVESGTAGWVYNQTTGELRVNDASSIAW